MTSTLVAEEDAVENGKTIANEDKMIIRNSVRKLAEGFGSDEVIVDSSTKRRRPIQAGRLVKRAIKKQMLATAMQKGPHWAKEHMKLRKRIRRRIYFLTILTLRLMGAGQWTVVGRSKGEPILYHIQEAPKHQPKKISLFFISVKDSGSLIPIEGVINSEQYKIF